MYNGKIVDHVERLRAKPEHIRMRLAMGTTFGATGLVVVLWASTLLVSGKLALNPYAGSYDAAPATNQVTGVQSSQVAGVVSAFGGAPKAAPTLQQVDVSTTTPIADPTAAPDMTGGNQTTISF